MNTQTKQFLTLLAGCAALAPLRPWASELVYYPINPMFGGNPNNGAMLLSSAQLQNKFKDPSIVTPVEKTELQQFNDSLQRSVLSRLSSAATTSLVGDYGQLIPGSINTANYHIVITDAGDGSLQVSTTDKASGESLSFRVDAK